MQSTTLAKIFIDIHKRLSSGALKRKNNHCRSSSRWHGNKNIPVRDLDRTGTKESREARGEATTRTDCFEQDS